jgi:hypothetical protein
MGLTAILAVIEAATALLPELSGLAQLIQSNAAGEAFTDTELAQLDSIAQSLNAKAAALAAADPQAANEPVAADPANDPVPPVGAA